MRKLFYLTILISMFYCASGHVTTGRRIFKPYVSTEMETPDASPEIGLPNLLEESFESHFLPLLHAVKNSEHSELRQKYIKIMLTTLESNYKYNDEKHVDADTAAPDLAEEDYNEYKEEEDDNNNIAFDNAVPNLNVDYDEIVVDVADKKKGYDKEDIPLVYETMPLK